MSNSISPDSSHSSAHAAATPASALGLGCVTFGREIDREGAFAMMDHAVAHGLTFFDTAAAYGGGASETIVGEWLAARGARSRVTLATKALPPYTAASIEASVTQSCRRFGVSSVDLLFLHRWDATAFDPVVLVALDRLVRRGIVREIGASNFNAEQLARGLALQAQAGAARFRALQNNHNLAVRSIDGATRGVCARDDVAIVTYSPLAAGFLTGKHQQRVEPGSRFDLIPGHQDVYFNDSARRRLARLQATAARTGIPAPHLALAWAMHQPQIATVLVGGRTTAHLDQALAARAFDAPELFRELEADE